VGKPKEFLPVQRTTHFSLFPSLRRIITQHCITSKYNSLNSLVYPSFHRLRSLTSLFHLTSRIAHTQRRIANPRFFYTTAAWDFDHPSLFQCPGPELYIEREFRGDKGSKIRSEDQEGIDLVFYNSVFQMAKLFGLTISIRVIMWHELHSATKSTNQETNGLEPTFRHQDVVPLYRFMNFVELYGCNSCWEPASFSTPVPDLCNVSAMLIVRTEKGHRIALLMQEDDMAERASLARRAVVPGDYLNIAAKCRIAAPHTSL